MTSTMTFDRLDGIVRVPVRMADDTYPFLVDSGIGITVVSSALAGRSDVSPTGESFSGRRMSGQVIETSLVRLPALQLGDLRVEDHIAGVADLGDDFAGILGPGFFEGYATTVNPDRMTFTIELASKAADDGVTVPLEVERDGPSLAPFARLVLPNGRTVRVEVDTGSQSLILATRHLMDCGLSTDHPAVETSTGTDATGHEWTRRIATIAGSVHLEGAPQTAQATPRVIFQDIIYDGLVGTDYLHRYQVTYDIAGGRMILHTPRSLAEGQR
jgi:predicted aspartyl protease